MTYTNRKCKCVSVHCPASYVTQRHHIVPQSWGGKTEVSNLIDICGNTHDATHDLLNYYVHNGGTPPESVLVHYNHLARDLAAQAWKLRPNDKPPYTVAHPKEPTDAQDTVPARTARGRSSKPRP